MLCPKCGFISFDHLSVCGKCNHDLSGIGTSLHGTAAATTCRLFLGSVLKQAELAAEAKPAMAATVSFPSEEPTEDSPEPMSLTLDLPTETVTDEGSTADQSLGLEFDLDEIPPLDSPAIDSVQGEEKISEAEQEAQPPSEEAITLLELEKEAEPPPPAAPPPEPTAEPAGQPLEIDVASLTLETGEETPPLPSEKPSAEEEQGTPPSIDLNEIDLSDLVHAPEAAPVQPGDGSVEPEGRGIDFEETMDLSLFVGESNEPPSATELPSDMTDGLEPIDLSLVDEALIELTMDPGHKEQTPKGEEQPEVAELRMEESGK